MDQDSRRTKKPLADSERSRFRKVINVFSKYADRRDFDAFAAAAQTHQ